MCTPVHVTLWRLIDMIDHNLKLWPKRYLCAQVCTQDVRRDIKVGKIRNKIFGLEWTHMCGVLRVVGAVGERVLNHGQHVRVQEVVVRVREEHVQQHARRACGGRASASKARQESWYTTRLAGHVTSVKRQGARLAC